MANSLLIDVLQEELLFRDRYRALWDLSVDGRPERKTKLPEGVRERRAAEFRALLPSLDEETVDWAAEQLLRRGVMNSPNVSERMISLARGRIYTRLAACFRYAAAARLLSDFIEAEKIGLKTEEGVVPDVSCGELLPSAAEERASLEWQEEDRTVPYSN